MLSVKIIDMAKGTISTSDFPVDIPINNSRVIWNTDMTQFTDGLQKENIVIHISYKDKSGMVYNNNFFPDKQKNMHYPKAHIMKTITKVENGYELTLSADVFTRGVFVSLSGKDDFISDNYMDLLPKEPVTIKITTELSFSDFEKNLKVISFSDTF
jgi:beta-mannosidase